MSVTRYKNPDPLPIDIEEAETKFFDWCDKEEKIRLSSNQAPIIPVLDITPKKAKGKPTSYHVSGGYIPIPRGYTAQ